jgi:hypothetical protein
MLLLGSEDAETQQICLAFAIIASEESGEQWEWFFRNCKDHLAELDTPTVGLISDRGKGLLNGSGNVFSVLHSLFCAKHLQRNIQATSTIKDANLFVFRIQFFVLFLCQMQGSLLEID